MHAGIKLRGKSAFSKVAKKMGYTVKTMTNTLIPPYERRAVIIIAP